MSNDKNKLISAGDICLILGIILLCVAGVMFFKNNKQLGTKVDISVDGEVVKTMELSRNGEYIVSTDMGTNTVVVKDGSVSVTSADCPDKVCVKHTAIRKSGETIICLPHKLVVEIK